jgi:TonB-linked SusC/RagA family outer membrane protein
MINFTKPTIRERNPEFKTYLRAMKLSVILCFLGMMQVSASVYSQNTRISFNYKEMSVKEVLNDIEKNTDIRFFYNEDFLDLSRKVTMEGTDKNVEEVLTSLLVSSDADYKVLENNLIVIAPKDMIQQKVVTGIITDSKTGAPVPGVNVVVKGTTFGTFTDANGKYSIALPQTNATLTFSFIGYISQEIPVSAGSVLDIKLIEESKLLDEVVVIGYGSRSKKDVTTSISTVSSKDITKSVNTSAEYSMMGRMAGVQVSGATGDPLARPTVRIRGVNTWGVADPIYVIDGIPVTEIGAGADALADGRFGTLRGNVNIMTLIDPNDIESISVLKDAASAAVYGVRAANGVILITTKQGKIGKPLLELNARYGVQNLANTYKMMNSAQLIRFKQDAYLANSTIGNDQTLWNELNPAATNYVGSSPETYNWQKAGINQNAKTQEYNLRLSGGTDKNTYSLSAGYASNDGMLLSKTMERYSLSSNISSHINKWLKLGANYRLSYVNGRDNTIEGFDLSNLSQVSPWQPIYDPNGYHGYASTVTINSDGLTGTPGKWASDPKPNVLGALSTIDNTYGEFRNLGSAYIEITPLKGLTFKGTLSGDYYKRKSNVFTDYAGWQFSYGTSQSQAVNYPNAVGSESDNLSENFNLVKEFSVNYVKAFGDHHIDLLFNAMDQKYNFYSVLGTGYAMLTLDPGLRYVGNMEDKNTNLQTDLERNALQGYLGRLSYIYKSKYYLDVTVRRDGSSKFAKEHQWGTFPGISAAWRISAEPFMENIAWVSDLKLRVARGSLGNMEVRDLAWAYVVNPNPAYSWGYSTDGLGIWGAGAAITDMANPSLTWEKTTTNNFGIDFTLSKGLSGSFEYYYKLTDGIIQQINLPPSLGYKNTPFVNLAKVSNRGVEIVLNYEGNFGDVRYSIGGNLTTVKNNVEKTYNHLRYFVTNVGWIEEGKPIGYERGYKFGGIYQTQAEADQHEAAVTDNGRSQKVVAGDAWFQDINGASSGDFIYETPGADGKLDSYDQTYLWNNIPPYYYGLNLGLSWKGVDFSALFNGVGGIYGHWDGLTGMGSRSNNTLVSALKSWTPENLSSWLPRNVYSDPNSNMRSSDRDKKSRSYLRMQDIQIGYTLPKSLYDFLGNSISYMRVYVGANNILTITRWPDLNPDGANIMPYVINFGINARF